MTSSSRDKNTENIIAEARKKDEKRCFVDTGPQSGVPMWQHLLLWSKVEITKLHFHKQHTWNVQQMTQNVTTTLQYPQWHH